MTSVLEYFTLPVTFGLGLGIFVIVLWKALSRKKYRHENSKDKDVYISMSKQDFTLDELKPYNGTDFERVLIAVNGKVFDVTPGKGFYGPGGPYHAFAGRDASRGLATFSIDDANQKNEYDDLSDLNSMQMESMREWEMQFTEKYDIVGRLLKPGEKHRNYKADESEDETKQEDKKEN